VTRRFDRIRRVPRSGAESYLKKAKEFFESLRHALQIGQWNTAGLTAVHCAISACDAVLVCFTEQRSASSDHEAAADLLESLSQVSGAGQKAETLRKILRHKNLIEYEDRPLTASEAHELAKLTERFFRWAKGLVEE